MNTVVEARFCTRGATVAVEASFTLTRVGAVGVGTDRVGVAVVEAEVALVHVGALSIGPARLGHRASAGAALSLQGDST